MSRRVTLRLLADERVEWIDAQDIVHVGWPSPEPDTQVSVLVPGETVTLLELPRVAGTDRQLTQALPALVEEQLVAPVEEQHLAWWAAGDGERLGVAAVLRADMDGWLARLRAAGHDDVGLALRLDAVEAGAREHLFHALRVVHVHLAAEGGHRVRGPRRRAEALAGDRALLRRRHHRSSNKTGGAVPRRRHTFGSP